MCDVEALANTLAGTEPNAESVAVAATFTRTFPHADNVAPFEDAVAYADDLATVAYTIASTHDEQAVAIPDALAESRPESHALSRPEPQSFGVAVIFTDNHLAASDFARCRRRGRAH